MVASSAKYLEDTKKENVSSDAVADAAAAAAAGTPTSSPPSEKESVCYTTSLATDPKTIDALSSLDRMWTNSDPSGHTSIATDPDVVGALKQMDDLWKQSQRGNTGTSSGTSNSDDGNDASERDTNEILRDSVWTKTSAAATLIGAGDESEDDEAPLFGDTGGDKKVPTENERKSIGINGGALLSIAMADAIDMQVEERAKEPRRFRPQPQNNPRRGTGGLFGLGRKPQGRSSPTQMADQGLLESDVNGSATRGYSDNPDESARSKGGLFGLGLMPVQRKNSRSVGDDGKSPPQSLSKPTPSIDNDVSSSDDDSSQDSSDEGKNDECAKNKNETTTPANPVEGTGDDGNYDQQRKARRGFFRRIDELERTNDYYTMEKMEVSEARDLEAEKNGNWQSKVGKIALGILVPEMYGDEAIEEIEGDISNARKGKYGQLSMSEDGDTDDEAGTQEDEKALEDTLRDQIRMLGGRVMELESELMEKTDEVATLSARVAELETKLAQHGAAVDKAWSSNLID